MLRWDIWIPQEISTQEPLMRSSSQAKSREQAAAEGKAAAANWPRGPQERRQRRREQREALIVVPSPYPRSQSRGPAGQVIDACSVRQPSTLSARTTGQSIGPWPVPRGDGAGR
ncbi:hypothetical protein QC761_601993 [Podospora bellae-mahoneyi]|uniref:Uncharacterized protein n=1 Tax=Podospora bellae-mahoneyi TaxID=2093777 RepID=A0ABR0FA35_9PEZI|nr:hypothetical protein QC761_601993 [Podospora bellae-mahoneyi]